LSIWWSLVAVAARLLQTPMVLVAAVLAEH
jgi:hypothetical protein